jgi:hypothetical protein
MDDKSIKKVKPYMNNFFEIIHYKIFIYKKSLTEVFWHYYNKGNDDVFLCMQREASPFFYKL